MHLDSKIFEKLKCCNFPISTIFGPRCDLKMPLKSRKMRPVTHFFVQVFFNENFFGKKSFGPNLGNFRPVRVGKLSILTFSSKIRLRDIFRFSRKSSCQTPIFFSLNLFNFWGHTRICRSKQWEKSGSLTFLAKQWSKMGQNQSILGPKGT